MTRLLIISATACAVIGFFVWLGSYCLPPLERRSDTTRFIARLIITLSGILFVIHSGILSVRSGYTWFVLVTALAFAVVLMLCWGKSVTAWFASFLTSAFDGGSEQDKPQPLYSAAEAKRKQGHVREAMYAIQEQLEKFPNDFRGQMLLAEIQAENANDLPGAEATIHRICSQPKHTPGQIASAFRTLADWHLRFDQDVDAARAALEEIVRRFPDTELAYNASQRLAHLADTATLIEARAPRTIVMKPSSDVPVHKMNPADVLPVEIDPAAEAARLVRHLTDFQNDTEAREELAKIYADHYGRIDLATEQLEIMIHHPTESPRHVARWLNLLADLQIRCTGDTQLAAATLQRLIERFPTQPFSDVARERLASLNQEVKRYEKSRVVKLGSA